MSIYKALNKEKFSLGVFSIVPIRMQDRHSIRKWRNEQIHHLRQSKPLTEQDQERYFSEVIPPLFSMECPSQLLFSYLKGEECIGYGGLVHINWIDRHAEVSFIMETSLEKEFFGSHWGNFLKILDQVAFGELNFRKIFTYAFDIRPHLYDAIEKVGFQKEAVLKDHCKIENEYKDVVIHSKFQPYLELRNASKGEMEIVFQWANSPIIRKYSFSTTQIDWESHQVWYQEKIKNSNCKYYILFSGGKPIGSIRFDLENNHLAKINYLVAPGTEGKGLGTFLLETGILRLLTESPQIQGVYGLVYKQNIPSMKIFEKLGFSFQKESSSIGRFSKKVKPVKKDRI